mgnify:CR=1 FL=1
MLMVSDVLPFISDSLFYKRESVQTMDWLLNGWNQILKSEIYTKYRLVLAIEAILIKLPVMTLLIAACVK